MNNKFQRVRFENNFPHIPLTYNDDKNQYVVETTQLRFEGWLKAVETAKENTVEMYFSRTYGWCLENLDGTGVEHPEFNEEAEAIDWATKQGTMIVTVDYDMD